MIQIHGHRGFRGKWPENTVTGFLKAIGAGATALELDVVVSADQQIVVSHEPWMSHKICLDKTGREIPEAEEKSHNIFRMRYEEICRYDCGTKLNPDFPEQTLGKAPKPLLKEVIQAAEAKIAGTGRKIMYNIEVKSAAGEEGFYPAPEEFVQLLMGVIGPFNFTKEQILVQSFDVRILREMKKRAPEIQLGLLVEESEGAEQKLEESGFKPDYLNPHFSLVTTDLVKLCRAENIRIVPWTVNNKTDMLRMLKMGASGLITDYPDRAAQVVREWEEAE